MRGVERRDFLKAAGLGGLALGGAACAPPPRTDVQPPGGSSPSLPVPRSRSVLVIGGGIAGLSAALELAEKGYAVTVREASDVLGGRLATRDLDPGFGETFRVEHGLHMWFNNYHTFYDIIDRLGVRGLHRPYEQVDFVFRDYLPEVLESSPKQYPQNLINIIERSPNLDWPDVLFSLGIFDDVLQYRHAGIYDRLDHLTFPQWRTARNIGQRFWDIILQPAASVTLNSTAKVSAAEMVLYQHFFFLSQPRAMDRTVTTVDHGTAIIDPWASRLRSLGVDLLTNAAVPGLRFQGENAIGVIGEPDSYDWVVMASEVGGTQRILAGSDPLDPAGAVTLGALRNVVAPLRRAPAYKILRVWFDRQPLASRPPVIESSQYPPINLLAIFDRLEDESKEWADRTGGSVIEFHLYANDMWSAIADDDVWPLVRPVALEVLPEMADARVLGQTVGSYDNFTSFEAGQGKVRPFCDSAQRAGAANVVLAGDWVNTDFPSALMERAVVTGRLAGNRILAADDVQQVPHTETISTGPGPLGFG